MAPIDNIRGIGPATLAGLAEIGVTSTKALAASDVARLTRVRGISAARAETYIAAAKQMSAGTAAPSADPAPDDGGRPVVKPKKSKADKKSGKKKKTTKAKAADKARVSVKKTKETKKKKADKAKAKNGKKAKK
ncbi:Helix-hairpin-helix domain-containing protein [Roseovarius azorensis]|uniref:Helix-hairpin-helix domain-containing protein n=1 Tax=Roseovarius azorensis TaxID=1287727 RepID=A0A1H7X1S9_9RHOB|nr:helix-hairpin-helix domain-containing protein [Roseovarius azorensis]SEM27187.1 Helix-hairpin-helix domain-containing protein [Roseovarius azorensis]